ncbi:hypothetical protein VTL71DRAFT_3558, partial [Oculimacula yallundae]
MDRCRNFAAAEDSCGFIVGGHVAAVAGRAFVYGDGMEWQCRGEIRRSWGTVDVDADRIFVHGFRRKQCSMPRRHRRKLNSTQLIF